MSICPLWLFSFNLFCANNYICTSKIDWNRWKAGRNHSTWNNISLLSKYLELICNETAPRKWPSLLLKWSKDSLTLDSAVSSVTISNEDLNWCTGLLSMGVLIRGRKWQRIGHTLRKGDECIAGYAMQWEPAFWNFDPKFKLEFQSNMQGIQESRILRTCDSRVFQFHQSYTVILHPCKGSRNSMKVWSA